MSLEDQKKQEEILACRNSLVYHLEHHFMIVDKDARLRLMSPLKPAQRRLLALYEYCKVRNWPIRIIILKARKEGLSTIIQALGYLNASQDQKTVLVVAHEKDLAETIFGMSLRFHEHYGLPKPKIPHPSRREMRFEGREGAIMVDTANNVQAGTGLTPHFLHLSEVAKWARGSETATALFQAVGDSPETCVIIESTAQGFDSLFQPYWTNAEENCRVTWNGLDPEVEVVNRDAWNGYIPLFIPWTEDPDYQLGFENPDEQVRFNSILTDTEKHLLENYGVTLEQLNWRRMTINQKCQGDLRLFKQEYPINSREAFLISGKTRFSIEALDLMPLEEGVRGFLSQADTWNRKIEFYRDSGGDLTVYRRPREGHRYVVSFDPSEGIQPEGYSDPDESVAHVYDLDDPEGIRQVAVLSGQIPEEEFIEPLKVLAAWYNLAYIFILTTGGFGTHAASRVADEYPLERMYRDASNRIGFKEHVGNKADLVSSLATLIEGREILFHDFKTVDQCRHYKRSSTGKLQAERGWHDDHVSAAYAGARAAREYPTSLAPVNSSFVDWRGKSYVQMLRRHRGEMDNSGGYSVT